MSVLDELNPSYAEQPIVGLSLANPTAPVHARKPVRLLVDWSQTMQFGGPMLPVEVLVTGPSGEASFQRHVDYRSIRTSFTFTPREGGRHGVMIREVAHNRWWGRLEINVIGDAIDDRQPDGSPAPADAFAGLDVIHEYRADRVILASSLVAQLTDLRSIVHFYPTVAVGYQSATYVGNDGDGAPALQINNVGPNTSMQTGGPIIPRLPFSYALRAKLIDSTDGYIFTQGSAVSANAPQVGLVNNSSGDPLGLEIDNDTADTLNATAAASPGWRTIIVRSDLNAPIIRVDGVESIGSGGPITDVFDHFGPAALGSLIDGPTGLPTLPGHFDFRHLVISKRLWTAAECAMVEAVLRLIWP